MPDYTIELSIATGEHKAWTTEVTVADAQRNVALPMGMDECFNWCAESETPVPAAAIEYWREARKGAMQMYEIQTELASRWGISFTIKEKEATPPEIYREAPKTEQHNRVATSRRNGASPSHLPDLRTMLQERLGYLQQQEKTVGAEAQHLRELLDGIRADIRQTSELLLTLGVKKPKRKKVEDGQSLES